MAASDFSSRAITNDPASHCRGQGTAVHLAALAGLLAGPWIALTEANAQTRPPSAGSPNAAAATTNKKSVPSIVNDPVTGKAIIIVGGSGRKGANGANSLNPQPLPPDPPPDTSVRRPSDLPATARQKPR